MSQPRIAPLEAPFSAPVQEALDKIMPPGVPPLALFRTFAVNERVFLRMMAGGLLDRGSIALRQREIMIDRTCYRCGSEYEWGVHVAFFGAKAELTQEEVSVLAGHPLSDGVFSANERLLLQLCDELHDRATVSDTLYEKLEAAYTPEQLIELVTLAGLYHTISFVTNAFGVTREPFGARFPE